MKTRTEQRFQKALEEISIGVPSNTAVHIANDALRGEPLPDVYPVLMSRENPEGFKLEELLSNLIEEVEAKNNYLKDKDLSEDDKKKITKQILINSNAGIIDYLRDALKLQNRIMENLSTLGPDSGPYKPRI